MSLTNEEKPQDSVQVSVPVQVPVQAPVQVPVQVSKPKEWPLLVLRLVAFLATSAAVIVMALNKESKKLVVATIGTNPITVSLTAKFQHTPAFVFFVIANAMASFHNLLMIAVDIFGDKLGHRSLRLVVVAVLDMLTVCLVSSGDGAATFMAELGKNGNSHARWNKICDKFETYCDRGGDAIIVSYIGLLLLLLITVLSTLRIRNPKTVSTVVV